MFARYHQLLRRTVRAAVNTSEENIEDAAFSWSKLLSRDLERIDAAYSWLTTVAIREALRLKRPSLQTSSLVTRDDEFIDLADPNDQLQLARTLVDAGEVVRAAGLSPRQTQVIGLQVLGFSYEEIAVRTGDSRRTVSGRLRGRRKLAGALRGEGGENSALGALLGP